MTGVCVESRGGLPELFETRWYLALRRGNCHQQFFLEECDPAPAVRLGSTHLCSGLGARGDGEQRFSEVAEERQLPDISEAAG